MPENPRIEELRRRVQADPASIAFAALAEEFRRTGRFDEAIETCRLGLQRHPAYLSARVTLGRALIEVGDYDAAREELETVLRSAPENLAAIRGLAQIHERLGHSTEMHPDLHAMMQEPIRVAEEKRARQGAVQPAPAVEQPEPAADAALPANDRPAASPQSAPAHPLDLGSLGLSGPPPAAAEPRVSTDSSTAEPVDIFASALLSARVEEVPAPPPMAFEPGTIAFEAPVTPIAPGVPPGHVDEPPPPAPDPHVAAMVLRLERFLGAIEAARRA